MIKKSKTNTGVAKTYLRFKTKSGKSILLKATKGVNKAKLKYAISYEVYSCRHGDWRTDVDYFTNERNFKRELTEMKNNEDYILHGAFKIEKSYLEGGK